MRTLDTHDDPLFDQHFSLFSPPLSLSVSLGSLVLSVAYFALAWIMVYLDWTSK